MKAKAKKKEKKEDAKDGTAPNISIVRRHSGDKEAYIMNNDKYLVTCKERSSKKYIKIIEQVCDELNEGKLEATKEKTRERVAKLCVG